ncbi:hypothetical protein DSM104329_05063 [Capillimicrobium parvum]|uniref:Uncharacterized protein n=2 Tax=Capillimicrobium parvum TaxID=2884022 RepID=A0A9E6Y2Y2_9ACTN|nr:hypothetical protein DSM104329_05063 [Capillimicrobium parvum]
MRFTAPSGTTISTVSIKRDLGKQNDGYRLYGKTSDGTTLDETCAIPSGQFVCALGGYGTPAATFSGLNAAWVAWGFACGDLGFQQCTTGSTLHQAWVHIYGSTVTLVDNQVPTSVSAGGAVTAGGWKGGSVGGAISGTDNLGVRNVRWYADGALVSTSADRACDYSVTVPCSNAVGQAYALDTTGLADGTRSIRAAVVDPAGNEAKSAPFDVDVDNTAPTAPENLQVGGGGAAQAISMTWDLPAADGGAPYVSSRWRACNGGTCSSGTGGLTSASGTVPGFSGTYAVDVWLVDQAGNQDIASAARGSVSYTAPAPGGGGSGGGGGGGAQPAKPEPPADTGTADPVAVPAPIVPIVVAPGPVTPPARAPSANVRVTTATVAKSGRLLVRGTIARAATGRVSVTYRATVDGRARSRSTRVRITRGRYAATITIPRTWRSARNPRVTVRYAGSNSAGATSRTLAVRT